VEEHGGKITVESAGGAGTAVAFSLPLQAPAQGDGTQGDGSEQEDGYPVSLLV
jgi:signal transduction histidine kinase